MKLPATITDSTGGAVGTAVTNTTSTVKDDVATLTAAINAIFVALRALHERLNELEGR